MGYQKALRKLESLPVGERQLAAGQYVWEVKKGKSHCGCAIGKLLTERQRVKLFKHESNAGGTESLAVFLGITLNNADSESIGVAGLDYGEARRLQCVNDSFPSTFAVRNDYATRKARYKHVIVWLKEQISQQATEEDYFAALASST